MKKRFFMLFVAASAALNLAIGQNATSWYSVKEVSPKVWLIDDHGADNMYLIEGSDSSLLVDTGLGTADLASFVKKLTSKPLIVVNTHGHPDHSSAARAYNRPEAREGSGNTMLQGNKPSSDELFKGISINTRLIPVQEGYIFNLGGRRIQVMETPGHTPGELCLLDIENKLLFTGDNNNVLVWLFLQNCKPLHEYLASLEKQVKRMAEFTTILPGHGVPIPADFIKDQVICVKGILDGTLERKPYKSFAGNAMISTAAKASVAFNPENL
jgi:hydroxyacylglutathione hydrolase